MHRNHILMFSHEFPPFLGGVGKIAYELVKEYSKNSQINLITKKQETILKVKKVNYFEISVFSKVWFLNYGWFYYRNQSLFDNAKIIYLNEAAPTIVAGMFFKKKHLEKSIIIAHGLEVEGVLESTKFFHRFFKIKKAYSRALKHSKMLLTLSDSMKMKLSKSIPKYANKIDYCYLGVDTNEFYYIKDVRNNSLYEKFKNNKIVGSCSRLVLGKGYIKMADIMKQLIEKDNNIIWLIAGDGNDREYIKSYIKSLNIENNVYFLGSLSFKELTKFYSALDIFMLLSNYDEVFPLVYIEAQLCGAISIGRNKGGTKEVVNKELGLLSNSDDEVIEFILNQNSFNREEIIEYAKIFTLEKNFKKWSNFAAK